MRFFKIFLIIVALLNASCSSGTKLYGGYYRGVSGSVGVTGKKVKVSKKDTVYALSRRYKVPVRDIIAVNNLKPPLLLRVGQEIVIPQARVHTVGANDTLYSISRRYGVDIRSLAMINNVRYPYTISKGQKLVLPATIVKAPIRVASSNIKTSSTTQTKKTPPYIDSKVRNNDKNNNTVKKPPVKPLPSPESRSKYSFAWPIRGKILSNYGTKGKGIHNDGINIKGNEGQSIISTENGVVAYTGNELKGFGNLILIKHSDGFMSAYAHTSKVLVKRGEKVNRGQKIAIVGKTGNVDASQLHFEIRKESKALDPLKYLEK